MVVRVIYNKNSRCFWECFILDLYHFIFRSDQVSLQQKALCFLIIDLCVKSFLLSVIYPICHGYLTFNKEMPCDQP